MRKGFIQRKKPPKVIFGRRLEDNRRMSYLPLQAQKVIVEHDTSKERNLHINTKQNRKFSATMGDTRKFEMPTAREGHTFASETPNTFHSAEEIDDSDEEFFDVEEASNSGNFKESLDSRKEKIVKSRWSKVKVSSTISRKSQRKKENQVLMEPKSNERKNEDVVMQMNAEIKAVVLR